MESLIFLVNYRKSDFGAIAESGRSAPSPFGLAESNCTLFTFARLSSLETLGYALGIRS